MKPWLIYQRERYPLLTYNLLAGGLLLAGASLSAKPFSLVNGLVGFIVLHIFFFTLRLMDELKDYEKDVRAHPERPLPRGLIKVDEAEQMIYRLMAAQLGCAVAVGVSISLYAAVALAVQALYLWGMFREFGIGEWLGARPLLYAISHQFIIFPVCACSTWIMHPTLTDPWPILNLGLVVLSGFFTYEVCRKLDPDADPILGTYLVTYGPLRTWMILLPLAAIGAHGADRLHLGWVLWPTEGLVLLSTALTLLLFRRQYRLAEAVATLSLLVHIWALPVLTLGFTS